MLVLAVWVLNANNDVRTRIADARQEASLVSVGNALQEIFGEVYIKDTSFQATQLTDDQLTDYINEAKTKASSAASVSSEDMATSIRAVTFTQRDGDTFKLISSDGSVTATVTLNKDFILGANYSIDRLTDI